MQEKIRLLQEYIDSHRRIVAFTGAGFSTESGIPDFRSADGIFSQPEEYPPEVILSHDFFMAKPEKFYDFYRRKMIFPDAQPNAAHRKLAELERAGKLTDIVTQNVDGLHTAAGNTRVHELHGTAARYYCMDCGREYGLAHILCDGVPRCACGGIVRPDVVLYGEELPGGVVRRAVAAIGSADMLLIAGTSLAVWPAAGLLEYFRGDCLVIINRSPTPRDGAADLCISGSVAEVLGEIQTR